MLANRGDDVVVTAPGWTLDAYLDDEDHVREVADPKCDVLVMQRLQQRLMVEAIPFLQKLGVAVVVDCDDDYSQVHRANVAFDAVHPRANPDANRRWLAAACKAADLVTVTTEALARKYGHHGRVQVIPNRLPAQVCSIEHIDAEPLRIGWAGNVAVHPDDPQAAGGAVAEVAQRFGLPFVNVGPGGAGKLFGIAIEGVTGFVEPRYWYARIAAELDVAVVPLAPTKFNQAKSSLALLTHSSVGVPAVASPTPDNRRVHALGMGVLAHTAAEWEHELTRMVTDDGWRSEVAHRSKDAARGESLEDHLDCWTEAWTLARDFHQWRHSG